MSFTFGFYNSFNHDRLYDAIQMSQIFDGMITDGVYSTIYDKFLVTADGSGMLVNVGTGRAWFNHTWNLNDAILPMAVEDSEIVLNRIDTLVIEIDSSEAARENQIKWVKGVPATNPVRPELTNNLTLHQYPLCDVYIAADAKAVNQENITNRVGTSDCPFVTGLLTQVTTDELIIQWQDQWDQYLSKFEASTDAWSDTEQKEFEDFVAAFYKQMNDFEVAAGQSFTTWFNNLQSVLDANAASNLQAEIEALQEEIFNKYYGVENKVTVIQSDKIVETSSDMVATTVFGENADGNQIITTTLVPSEGSFDYIKTVTFEGDSSGGTKVTESYVRRGK